MTHRPYSIESKPTLRTGVTVRLAPWFALSMMSAAVGTAYAQNVPAPAGAASAPQTAVEKKAADEATAQTITISATRRRELIRDVPLAITAVTTERLAESGAKNLNDYLAAVPGVVLQNSGVLDGVGNIVIRGLTAGTDSNSPTTIYIDDVPMALGSTFDVNLLDQSRFEVLRGPQGTLYGSSALGGVVKYITNEPNTYELSGKVGLGLSQTQHGGLNIAANGVVNVPLKQDVAALRVAVFGTRDAGWVNATGAAGKDGVDKRDSNGGRISLLLTPDRDLSVKLTAMTQTRNSDGGQRIVYDPATHKPATGDLIYSNLGFAEPRTGKRDLYSLTVDYDLKWAKFYSITAHQTVKEVTTTDFTPFGIAYGTAGAYVNNQLKNTKTTQEFRLVSQSSGEFQWLAGLFFDKIKLKSEEQDYLFAGAPILFGGSDGNRDYKETAVYGNVTWNATADLAVTGGLRVAKYKQTDLVGQINPATGAAVFLLPVNFEETPKTYLLASKYRLTPQSNVYARAASGYRPGGANFAAIDQATGQPFPGARASYGTDSAWTYEAGYKANFPESAASVEVGVFDTEWKDLQQFTQPGGIGTAGFTSNLGKARIRGIEAGASFKPTSNLSLGASLSFMDPKLLTDSPGLGAFAGDRLPNSPKSAAALTSRYSFDLAGQPAFAGLNVVYQGSRNSGFEKSMLVPNYVLPSFTQLDLSGGVKLAGFDIGVFVRNLSNVRGQLGATTGEQATTGRTYVHVIDPRTIGLTLAASF
jgi:outer membrane receptor protein involved in Fe transport